MKKMILALAVVATLFLCTNLAFADLMTIQYSGPANTLGSNSSPEFHGSTISGRITYESASAPTEINQSTWDYRFWGDTIRDFSFTITLPDSSTYVSTGLFINSVGEQLGGLDLKETQGSDPYPRIDLASQGIFAGPDFHTQQPSNFFFQIYDGNPYEPPAVLSGTQLPDSPFTLDQVNGGASMRVIWQNVQNGPYFQFQSYLTSLSVSPATETTPVPEPSMLLLLGGGLTLVGLRRLRG
jgi:hypothetical protein